MRRTIDFIWRNQLSPLLAPNCPKNFFQIFLHERRISDRGTAVRDAGRFAPTHQSPMHRRVAYATEMTRRLTRLKVAIGPH